MASGYQATQARINLIRSLAAITPAQAAASMPPAPAGGIGLLKAANQYAGPHFTPATFAVFKASGGKLRLYAPGYGQTSSGAFGLAWSDVTGFIGPLNVHLMPDAASANIAIDNAYASAARAGHLGANQVVLMAAVVAGAAIAGGSIGGGTGSTAAGNAPQAVSSTTVTSGAGAGAGAPSAVAPAASAPSSFMPGATSPLDAAGGAASAAPAGSSTVGAIGTTGGGAGAASSTPILDSLGLSGSTGLSTINVAQKAIGAVAAVTAAVQGAAPKAGPLADPGQNNPQIPAPTGQPSFLPLLALAAALAYFM